MAERDEIKSLKKALRALTLLNHYGEATAARVAQGVGVPRATAYRLLETLVGEGYVAKLPGSDRYVITSLVQQLAAGFEDNDLLVEVSRPLIAALQRKIAWPLALATPRGARMLVRVSTDHDSPLALERYGVGSSLPILQATSGYCYLAFCSDAEREELLRLALRPSAAGGAPPFDEAAARQMISGTRERGFCNIEFQHFREGNIGVPVFITARPVAGLVMRYIKSALADKTRLLNELLPQLKELAQEITRQHDDRVRAVSKPGPPFD